jgi:hypothetical protein
MAREFKEETGINTQPDEWERKLTLHGDGWRCSFLAIHTTDFWNARTVTDEMVTPIKISELATIKNIIPNLRWLVPFCAFANVETRPYLREKEQGQ